MLHKLSQNLQLKWSLQNCKRMFLNLLGFRRKCVAFAYSSRIPRTAADFMTVYFTIFIL